MGDFKVTLKHPHFGPDVELEVGGIGVMKNGESITVTQEMQDAFQAVEGFDLKKSLAQTGAVEFQGKKDLMDNTQSLEEINADEQVSRDPNATTKEVSK